MLNVSDLVDYIKEVVIMNSSLLLARRRGDDKLDVNYFYIGVPTAIAFFLIGIFVGVFFDKKFHSKQSTSEKSLIHGANV